MTPPAAQIPSSDTVRRALSGFRISVDDNQVLQIQEYIRILLHWNERLNLTAIRDPLEILHRHFGESMYAASAVPVENGRLADVGSGAGFPGIPLKIVRPEVQVFLIESNIKKATFMAEVIRELALQDTRVLVSRYEELGEEIAPLDYICSRALGEFPSFLEWAASPVVSAAGVLLWIGTRDLEEVRKIRTWAWREPIEVPHSLRRVILVGVRRSAADGEVFHVEQASS
jgi:16S rRNA (guanine527-N7)-methyltransferase